MFCNSIAKRCTLTFQRFNVLMTQKSRFQEIRYSFLKGPGQLWTPSPGPRRSRATTGLDNTPMCSVALDFPACRGRRIAAPQMPSAAPNVELRVHAQGRIARPTRRRKCRAAASFWQCRRKRRARKIQTFLFRMRGLRRATRKQMWISMATL
jgi:hypothetical protein